MSLTNIEWTDATWNPVTGCDKVSPGCKHCYAETMAKRLKAMGKANYRDGFKLTLQPHMLGLPLQRKKPTTYFVNSMSDLFHKDVPLEYIRQVFDVMRRAHWHTFQVLTKRSERLVEVAYDLEAHDIVLPKLKNVWIGVSVENERYKYRIDHLSLINAAVRFLSLEPLLGDLGELDLRRIGWVIVGGESGHNARPMHPDWARSVRDQCLAAKLPFFFKQWGEWTPGENVTRRSGKIATATLVDEGEWMLGEENLSRCDGHRDDQPDLYRVGKNAAGRMLDGELWDQMPEGVR